MRVVIQRVKSSSVVVDDKVVGEIGRGLNLLVGIAPSDTIADVTWMAQKCLNLCIFPSAGSDRCDLSVQEIQGDILVISQFTLYGDCRKGRRPSFSKAAPSYQAEALYDQFVEMLQASGLVVKTGIFGAMMQVTINNDGPVTLLLDREVEA